MSAPSPAARWRPSRKVLGWLAVYAITIGAIYVGLGLLAEAWQGELRRGLLSLVLPDDWLTAGDRLVESWLRDHRPAVVNLLVSTVAVLVPALTFPLKEAVSARYEADLHPPDWQKPREHPLWIQALDEVLLLVIFAALALGALRVSLTPGWAQVGFWLTHGVLAFTFAVDFIGPTLTRHRIAPTAIYLILFRRAPLRALVFGAFMAAPPLIIARLFGGPETDPKVLFGLLAIANTACVAVSVLVGTRIGTRIAHQSPPPARLRSKGPFWAVMLALLIYNGAFFGSALKAAVGVSPILKCQWSLEFDTFDVDLPSLLDPAIRVTFAVRIDNPTGRDAVVGDNRIELKHGGKPVADTRLPPLNVPAGGSARQELTVVLDGRSGLLDKAGLAIDKAWTDGVWSTVKSSAASIADPQQWAVIMTVPVSTGELVVPIFDGAKPAKTP